MGDRDRPIAESAKQVLALAARFHTMTDSGPVRGTEHVDQADQGGLTWFTAEQPMEIVAKRTARAGDRGDALLSTSQRAQRKL
jgi:hypothetical protein